VTWRLIVSKSLEEGNSAIVGLRELEESINRVLLAVTGPSLEGVGVVFGISRSIPDWLAASFLSSTT
jgi:hypothetical protein